MIRAGLLAALLFVAGAASAETDAAAMARSASAQLREAARSLESARRGRDRVRALTTTVQAYEDGLAALRAGMRLAAREERVLQALLDARDEEVSLLLGALVAMGRPPAPLLLLHPDGPIGNARSAMIVSDVTPDLQREADVLRHQLEEIAALRKIQEDAEASLAEGMSGAQEARTALSQAIADRVERPQRFAADPERMRALVETVDSLDAFAAGLAEIEVTHVAGEVFADPGGTLPLPVQGVLLRGFNEADAAGVARPGLLLAARPGALVTAPSEGTVRYVGPLLDYGNVMILEPGANILLVLAGMGTVYGAPGEVVQKGAPLGFMGAEPAVADEFLAESQESGGAERGETLYMELRRGEVPVDPADWFALSKAE